ERHHRLFARRNEGSAIRDRMRSFVDHPEHVLRLNPRWIDAMLRGELTHRALHPRKIDGRPHEGAVQIEQHPGDRRALASRLDRRRHVSDYADQTLATSAARLTTCAFSNIAVRWTSTVFSAMPRVDAIVRFERPRTRSASTSRCRRVSPQRVAALTARA